MPILSTDSELRLGFTLFMANCGLLDHNKSVHHCANWVVFQLVITQQAVERGPGVVLRYPTRQTVLRWCLLQELLLLGQAMRQLQTAARLSAPLVTAMEQKGSQRV